MKRWRKVGVCNEKKKQKKNILLASVIKGKLLISILEVKLCDLLTTPQLVEHILRKGDWIAWDI